MRLCVPFLTLVSAVLSLWLSQEREARKLPGKHDVRRAPGVRILLPARQGPEAAQRATAVGKARSAARTSP